MNYQQYETRPLETWAKGIELRRQHRRHLWEAHSKGDLLVHGMGNTLGLLAGMGDFAVTELTPGFRSVLDDPEVAVRCHEAAEAKGWNQDICSSMRCHLGSYLLGLGWRSRSGEALRPDFILQGVYCIAIAKACQIYSDLLGVPYYTVDVPHNRNQIAVKYMMEQMEEAIEWMEKITGRKYDDEKLIEGTRNEWQCFALFAKILELNKTIPAPLDWRHLYTLEIPLFMMRHKSETVEFYRLLLGEVKERVKDGISARGYERCRLVHGGFPPMYYEGIFKYPQQYGAIYVASELVWAFALWSPLDIGNRGWPAAAAITPEEAGYPLRNREDALRVLADLSIFLRPNLLVSERKPEEFAQIAHEWHADAAIIHIDRGCKGMHSGMLEAKLALDKEGVPTLLYEASGYDPRDFNEVEVLDRIDSFMGTLGLSRIAPEGNEKEVHDGA